MSKFSKTTSYSKRSKVIVVMPAYNASKTILTSYRELPKKYINEIILVDDASTDNTYEIANKLPMTVYRNSLNLGYGGNLKVCLTKALEHGADTIIEYHPDSQYDPKDLTLFIEKANAGYDFALGSRFVHPKEALHNKMPLVKFIANRALSFIDEFVLGIELSEFHSGFRMYTRQMLEKISYRQNSDDYLFSFEVIVQAVFKGMRIAEVPISCKYHPNMHTANLKRSAIYALGTFKTLAQYLGSKFLHVTLDPFIDVKWVECPFCNDNITRRDYTVVDGISGEKFTSWFCTPCQLGFTMPIPTNFGKYYPKDYYSAIKTYIYPVLQFRRRQYVRMFKSRGTMLDIGCGDGAMAGMFPEFKYVGIETPFAATNNRSIKQIGAENMNEKPKSYDVVTFWESFEHLRSPKGVLKKSRLALKNDGVLIIECPNYSSFERVFFNSKWFHLDPPRHLSYFTPKGLKNLLGKYGFSVIIQKLVFAPEYTPVGLAQSLLYLISPRLNLVGLWQRKHWLGIPATLVLGGLLFLTIPLTLVFHFLGGSPILLTVARSVN